MNHVFLPSHVSIIPICLFLSCEHTVQNSPEIKMNNAVVFNYLLIKLVTLLSYMHTNAKMNTNTPSHTIISQMRALNLEGLALSLL